MTDQPMPQPKIKKTGSKKWMVWGLVGFTVILLATALVLFLQLKKPAAPTLPTPKPAASPQAPPVQETKGENVCEVAFEVPELECTDVLVDPTGTAVESGDIRELTAQVTGGSGTYFHEWTIDTDGSDEGSLSSNSTNPTDWTAPEELVNPQEWTITDTVTDDSVTVQTAVCEVTLQFGGLIACFDTCEDNNDCDDDLECLSVSGDLRCVNPDCPEETDCVCDLLGCDDECESDEDCVDDLRCMSNRCRNAECPDDSDCICDLASPSPSPSPREEIIVYVSPSPEAITKGGQPALPEAGVATPAVLGASIGIILVILGLLF